MSHYSLPFLDKSLQISSLLLDLVCPSFGPSGKNVIIITNVGRMLVTNSGKTILKHVTVEHPIARYIISSLQNFHERYGDGCVSLIISLHACLDGVCRKIKDLTSQIQLSHALVQIRNNFIYSSSFLSHMLRCAQKIPVDAKEEIYEKMKMIVQTLFEGKFGPLPSYHLSLSIVQWISSHSSAINAKTITEVVNQLIKYTPVVTFTNRNIDETEVWSGFVIARSSVGAKLHSISPFPVNFMVLDEDFGKDPKREENNAIISVSSQSELLDAASFETIKIRNFLQTMVKEDIKVLMCTGSVSDNAIGCAKQFNIFIVPYVSQEDIERICKQAKMHPIYNYSPKVFESDRFRAQHVGSFSEIREFSHSGKGYVHVTISDDYDSHTLALNGPSEGLCEQYSEMIDRALLLIRSWLTWRPPCVTDLIDYPEFEGFKNFRKEDREGEGEQEREREREREREEEYLYSIPGGAAIELELYFIFRNMEINTKQKSMWLSLGFDVLAKGMVSIPSHITRSFSSANRSFLRELLNLQQLHNKGQFSQGFIVTSLSRKKYELEQVPELREYTGDTLAEVSRFEFLLHVIDTMIHILRIDGVYSSKKIIT